MASGAAEERRRTARLLGLLAHADRLAAVEALAAGPSTLEDLVAATGLTAEEVARHIDALAQGGLVRVWTQPCDPTPRAALEPAAWAVLLQTLGRAAGSAGPAGPDGARAGTLRAHPFFGGLPPDDLAALASRAVPERYEAGEAIITEGDPCPGLYVVARGSVKVFRTSPDGREQVLRIMRAGDSFNEVPAFDGGPNPASAAAAEPTLVYLVPAAEVQRLLRSSPAFAAAVAQVFAGRLRHLVALVEDLAFRQVVARVAKVLLQTVQPGDGVGAGLAARPATQRDLADLVGTAREVVSRALRVLEDQGAVRLSRGRVEVVDSNRLAAAAQVPAGGRESGTAVTRRRGAREPAGGPPAY